MLSTGTAQQSRYQTLGYRSCGTERGTCHQGDGNWWKADPHFGTIIELKRDRQKSMAIAQAYGMKPGDYLKGNSKCAECHGEVVQGRAGKNMNTGVSCESCHGPAGPKGTGYFEVHQEGLVPQDPLSTERTGYRAALRVGMLELRNTGVRAVNCVNCHQINEKKLLEAGHPTGEGFDYIKGIRNQISKHWDYKIRQADLDDTPYKRALQNKPIPQFTVKQPELPAGFISGAADTIYINVDPFLPPWLNPEYPVSVKPFEPKLDKNAPVDSILIEIKKYIEYLHRQINEQ
jgi:hypothetical protein